MSTAPPGVAASAVGHNIVVLAYPFAWRSVPFDKVLALLRKAKASPSWTCRYLAAIAHVWCRNASNACLILKFASAELLPSLISLGLPWQARLDICPRSFTVRSLHGIQLRRHHVSFGSFIVDQVPWPAECRFVRRLYLYSVDHQQVSDATLRWLADPNRSQLEDGNTCFELETLHLGEKLLDCETAGALLDRNWSDDFATEGLEPFSLQDTLDLLDHCAKGPRKLQLMTQGHDQLRLLDLDQVLHRLAEKTGIRDLSLTMRIGTPDEMDAYLEQFTSAKLYDGDFHPGGFNLRLKLRQPGDMEYRDFVHAIRRVPLLIACCSRAFTTNRSTWNLRISMRRSISGSGSYPCKMLSAKWRARDPERNDPSMWNQWRETYRFPRTWVDDEDDDGWDDEDWDESVNGWQSSEFDGEVKDDGAEESSVSSS
ncbi:LOW QUALITY PROTEIN: hypothetical protein JCM24511_07891 [Saitozyma sp. JCM 24511]|nr:LOW QUALITY PROTEIN: hypothetical protein JCM24511_07891 [Saitozyma sp. JCM 24511]